MEDDEIAVGGGMHVELDDIGAGREGGTEALDRVLDVRVFRREDALGGAGLRGQALAMVGLAEAAMGDDQRPRVALRGEEVGVEEEDGGSEDEKEEEGLAEEASHRASGLTLFGPAFLNPKVAEP
jgi:hypothetical protein